MVIMKTVAIAISLLTLFVLIVTGIKATLDLWEKIHEKYFKKEEENPKTEKE